MPESFNGLQIKDIWTTFLHISGQQLTNQFQPVFDGGGVQSSLYLSTTAAKATNLEVGSISYPASGGNVNDIPVLATANSLVLRSITNVLSTAAPLSDGLYSSPNIRVTNGIIAGVVGTGGSTKTFILPNRLNTESSPDLPAIIAAISWINPTDNDVAIVLQKVRTPVGVIADITIYKLTYSSNKWNMTTQY